MKISLSQPSGALLLSTATLATLLLPSLRGAKAPSGSTNGGFAPLQARRAPQAPELCGGRWFNTPNDKPLTLASRRGEVTIVEFWTFACSNCRANLPA